MPGVTLPLLDFRWARFLSGCSCLASERRALVATARLLVLPETEDEGGAHIGASPGFYFAFLFSVSIRSLAAGPDDAGFWPVISWPSATV